MNTNTDKENKSPQQSLGYAMEMRFGVTFQAFRLWGFHNDLPWAKKCESWDQLPTDFCVELAKDARRLNRLIIFAKPIEPDYTRITLLPYDYASQDFKCCRCDEKKARAMRPFAFFLNADINHPVCVSCALGGPIEIHRDAWKMIDHPTLPEN